MGIAKEIGARELHNATTRRHIRCWSAAELHRPPSWISYVTSRVFVARPRSLFEYFPERRVGGLEHHDHDHAERGEQPAKAHGRCHPQVVHYGTTGERD